MASDGVHCCVCYWTRLIGVKTAALIDYERIESHGWGEQLKSTVVGGPNDVEKLAGLLRGTAAPLTGSRPAPLPFREYPQHETRATLATDPQALPVGLHVGRSPRILGGARMWQIPWEIR
jgi:hypothetical protein